MRCVLDPVITEPLVRRQYMPVLTIVYFLPGRHDGTVGKGRTLTFWSSSHILARPGLSRHPRIPAKKHRPWLCTTPTRTARVRIVLAAAYVTFAAMQIRQCGEGIHHMRVHAAIDGGTDSTLGNECLV